MTRLSVRLRGAKHGGGGAAKACEKAEEKHANRSRRAEWEKGGGWGKGREVGGRY